MRRFIKFFSSVKLAIILLICLAFTSIIGTIIAQKQNPALYIQHYGKGLYTFFRVIGFFDVYHSWWYIALLILISINILFCSLRRLPRDLKKLGVSYLKLDEESIKEYKLSHTKMFHRPMAECRDAFLTQLTGKGLTVSRQEDGERGALHMLSEKNRYGFLFFYLTHLSILIILLGGIISATTGIKGYVQIPEGETSDTFIRYPSNETSSLGFRVRCDKFEIEYYPNTLRPKDYRSHLTILDQGKEMASKVIEVNKPFTYKGISLYQSSYGEDTQSGELLLRVKPIDTKSEEPPREFHVKPGGDFEFTGADGRKRKIKVIRFLPDFAMDAQGKAFSKSDQLKNPAVQLMVTTEGAPAFMVWSFQMFPDFQMVKRGEYMYSLKGYEGRMYTGLQVGKDPGVWVVWLGCILLMFGVILVLFSSHQRVWATISPVGDGCSISIAGHADKNKVGFEEKFGAVWQGLLDLLEKKKA